MTADPLARPCARVGCTEQGVVFPVLCFFTVRALMTLPLCDNHAKQATVEDLLVDDGFRRLEAEMRQLGKRAPTRADFFVEFVPIASAFHSGEFNA